MSTGTPAISADPAVLSALRKHLTETLRDRDATIVKGWLEGIAQGGA